MNWRDSIRDSDNRHTQWAFPKHLSLHSVSFPIQRSRSIRVTQDVFDSGSCLMQFIFISTPFKSLWLRFFFNVLWTSAHQVCIYLKEKNTVNSKYCEILLQFWMYCKIWIYCKIKCIPVIKAAFSASLILQSSVLHDPSKIIIICWFAAQETFLIIIIVENSCAASYFVETVIHFSTLHSLINRKLKSTMLIWNINLL